MLKKSVFLLLILFLLASLLARPIATQAAPSAPLDLQSIDSFLTSQLQANRIPGLAVTIIRDGQVVFSKGYGEAAPGRPVTPQTQFTIASLTKSFTALAILQLVEQGKVQLDAPVQTYIPWFTLADPDAAAKITIRHLLNQTSGLGQPGDPNNQVYFDDLEQQIRVLQYARPIAPVGTQFRYLNQNYRILGYVIEQVSGQRYGDYLREHILTPLGMTHTVAHPDLAPELAQGHTQVFGQPVNWKETFYEGVLPEGGLISNAEDMGRYALALLNAGEMDGQRVIQPESWALMTSLPQGIDTHYGMGWHVDTDPELGGRIIFHDGASEDFHSELMMMPDRKTAIVLLYNQSGLIPLMTSLPSLLPGIARLLDGRDPQAESFGWLGPVLALVAGLHLSVELLRVARLKHWARRTLAQKRWLQWLQALPELLIGLLLLWGLPGLIASLINETGGWKEMFSVLPDLTAWWLLAIGLAVLRGAVKTYWVVRQAA